MHVSEESLNELKKEFLKLEKDRWFYKKHGKEDRFSSLSYQLGGTLIAIQMLGLSEEFGIRRAGPYYKEIVEE